MEEISAAVGRNEQAVARVVQQVPKPKKSRQAAKKAGPGKQAAKVGKASNVKSGMATSAGRSTTKVKQVHGKEITELLEHRFWLRSGLSVSLSLPEDLRADEAERLAEVVRSLPFS